VRSEILVWHADHGRDLPWRRTKDPYAVLVSEVMLQQTQVARVVPRWERWLDRWPTPGALAGATPADVLREWVGLGYNRRALRLRDACAVVARRGWPERLEDLPGVGPYTAAALRIQCFGGTGLAMDTNVARVCARVGACPVPERGHSSSLLQAMFDLGATVCTARAPRCASCPLRRRHCRWDGEEAPRRPGPRRRFEDSDRWARGRVVAALAAGGDLPALEPARLERVLAGLERDGLVVRAPAGGIRLP
jgi:A/G-specific adenine glycosylase